MPIWGDSADAVTNKPKWCPTDENSEFNIQIRNYFLTNGYDQTNVIYYFTKQQPIATPDIICNYVFLGDDERQMFAQTSHEYLITQVQYNLFQG